MEIHPWTRSMMISLRANFRLWPRLANAREGCAIRRPRSVKAIWKGLCGAYPEFINGGPIQYVHEWVRSRDYRPGRRSRGLIERLL
jgi:hypothetical protein